MSPMKNVLCLLLLWMSVAMAAPLKVATLHPLLSDMARCVGGEAVEVAELFPKNADLHTFAPTSAHVAAAAGSKLLLACGKGVEPYLGDLRDALGNSSAVVLELGASIPDVTVPGSSVADPHWWNAPENMKRASQTLCDALQQVDPEHAEDYARRQQEYAEGMDRLTRLGRLTLASIPRERRVLVCAHAAMCHFCEAFHFTPLAAQGVARESEGDTAGLAKLLAELRAKKVRCMFTELKDSPKFLENIAAQIGAQLRPLVMDGVAADLPSYKDVFLFNLTSICEGLSSSSPQP